MQQEYHCRPIPQSFIAGREIKRDLTPLEFLHCYSDLRHIILAEQQRIVARVEALLRQCDALEAQLRQARTLGAHLLDSTPHHLLAA